MADRPDFAARLEEGVEHFNHLRFWEAHESWEELWLVADETNQFLQGLIQVAAAYHHVQRGTTRGAIRLFDAALRRLASYPPFYCGVDRRMAIEFAERDRRRLTNNEDAARDNDYPKLILTGGWQRQIPERW